MSVILATLHTSVRMAAPYLLIALGGLLCHKAGIFNLALEGFATFGCFAAVAGAQLFGSIPLAILFAVVTTAIFGFLFSIFVLELKVNPMVASLAFNLIGTGISRYLLSTVFMTSGRLVLDSSMELPVLDVPVLNQIPVIGDIFNNLTSLTYIAFLIVIIAHIVLYRTKFGFCVRIIGLDENVAISTGVNVKKVRHIGTIIGAAICGLAGAQLALSIHMFNVGMVSGRGWTAVVILMMANSRPIPTALLSLLFGAADTLVIKLSGQSVSSQLLATIPYILAFSITVIPLFAKRVSVSAKRMNAARKYINN